MGTRGAHRVPDRGARNRASTCRSSSPPSLVALGFSVGAVLTRHRATMVRCDSGCAVWFPFFVAGAAGALVLGVWAVTRWETIVGFTSTVYPGERLQPVGHAGLTEVSALFSGIFSVGLGADRRTPVRAERLRSLHLPPARTVPGRGADLADRRPIPNEAPASTGCRSASCASGALMLAFLFIPGWDAIAHLAALGPNDLRTDAAGLRAAEHRDDRAGRGEGEERAEAGLRPHPVVGAASWGRCSRR